MTKPVLRLDWCSHEAAKYAVEHWHYSRSLPTPPLVKVGAWESGRFIGCVLFSRGASDSIGRPFSLQQTEIAELTRVALTGHQVSTSRIVRLAILLLRRCAPGLRLLISYADPNQGHHGGIYQAGGWLYLGKTAPDKAYIGPDGKRWHSRMVATSGRKKVYGAYRPVWRPEQCRPVALLGKHKYALPLDDAMRRQIEPLRQPYPKRAGSIAADAPAAQAGEGGSTPTPALLTPSRADAVMPIILR